MGRLKGAQKLGLLSRCTAGRNNRQPMKSNRPAIQSPVETRSLASALEIVASLLHFFQEFGFERDARFAGRASVFAANMSRSGLWGIWR